MRVLIGTWKAVAAAPVTSARSLSRSANLAMALWGANQGRHAPGILLQSIALYPTFIPCRAHPRYDPVRENGTLDGKPVHTESRALKTFAGNRTSGERMNLEKVIFGFFILLAATLNFGFFIGDIARPELHNVYELFAAITVNLIATVLKFGDRTQIGAIHLATSLVADLQLIAAAIVWAMAVHVTGAGMTVSTTSSVLSLSGGALFANVVSVIILIAETVMMRR